MPTAIIPFPRPGGGASVALLKTGKKRTVRFVPRPPRAVAPPTHADQTLIDGARMTAANFRRLAAQAGTAHMRRAMEENAAKWERRAAELTATKHGPQQPAGELFQ